MEDNAPKTLAPNPAPPPPPMAPLPILHPPIAPIPIAPIPVAPAPAPSQPLNDEYEVTESSRQARERHERAVQDLLLRRRAQTMAVPTNDSAVRAFLRRLSEPVTLFGEREMERRDRLRSLLAHIDPDTLEDLPTDNLQEEEEEQIQYPFYTEAPPELLQARLEIANYSLPRAKARIERARRRRDDPDEDPAKEAEVVVKQAVGFELDSSEIGDERPLTGCSFSRDGSMLATRYGLGEIAIEHAILRNIVHPYVSGVEGILFKYR